jgi:hypothetical protein
MRRVVERLAVVAALAAGGCAVVAGLDGERRLGVDGAGGGRASTTTTTTTTTGGHDAGAVPDAGAPDADRCTLATFPAPPALTDAGGDVELVVAIQAIDVGDTGSVIGFDLDAKCTCDGDGPSCMRPAAADDDACDGPGGRDARSADIFKQIVLVTGSGGTDDFSATAKKGSWTMLVRIQGWNGHADDDRVRVSVFPSSGLPGPATWDGTDAWPIPETAIAKGASDVDHPRFFDDKAYVAGHVLVTSLPESELVIAGTEQLVSAHLTAGFVTGRLEQTPLGWALHDGTVAARWKLSDVFETLGGLRVAGAGLCKSSPYYAAAKKLVCGMPDITSTLASPTATCDAVSVGMRFQAEPAKLGAIVAVKPVDPPCKPGEGPADDSCD